MKNDKVVIRRALIGVSDKAGIADFAKALERYSVEIVSTGGTAAALEAAGVKVRPVENFTGLPEMLDGRVKTLHPKIHGGILARRGDESHQRQMQQHSIEPIDLVVVNFYPFEKTVAGSHVRLADAIENIDIGGPTLVRAAAKNHDDVAVVVDAADYAKIAAELDRLNIERRVIEQAAEAQAEAEALASLGLEDKGSVIVTASEGWHPGIVGLVASRLKDKFSRPTFAIALEPGGIGTGSGRSIGGVDLGKAVRQAVHDGLLMKGGGHAMAAGVTLRKERLAEFRAYMEDALAHDVAQSRHVNEIFIDGAVSARGVTTELAATLNRAGPFGSGNPEPVLALPSHQLVYADEVGQAHLRVRFKSGDGAIVNGIAFRSIGQKLGNALAAHRGQVLHVAGSLAVDRWQGTERVQLRVLDVAVPDQGPAVIR